MKKNRALTPILLLLASLLFPAAARAELGLNVYGFSYHFQRDEAKALGLDNELNPGIGLRYRRPWRERIDFFFDAGVYRDSGRNTALVFGPGGLWKAGERLRLGGALAVFNSDTYNRGKTALAPVPVAAYELRSVSWGVTNHTRIPRRRR